MIKLTVNQVIKLHKKLIDKTGGSHGIRDMGLIESAVKQIDQTFDNIELYPSIEQKTARLAYSLISNHGFVDGNKRIGVLAMLVFLEMNKIRLKFSQQELIHLGLYAASGDVKYPDILEFINKHK